jgi:hypothetical protein
MIEVARFLESSNKTQIPISITSNVCLLDTVVEYGKVDRFNPEVTDGLMHQKVLSTDLLRRGLSNHLI